MKNLIIQASNFLQGKIRVTPLEVSPILSQKMGYPVYLKLESLQLTGSFKIRGAFFYLSMLSDEEKKRGVAACSAGNHGLGMAYAAKKLQIPCTIFVPKSIDEAKYEKLIELGAHVKKSSFEGYDLTLKWAMQETAKLDLTMVSAFDDEKIMAANGGTLALEILEQLPSGSHFVLPVGGGGLAAGFSFYMKSEKPKSWITTCLLAESPAFKLSLEQGKAVTHMPSIKTLAGGLEGGLGEKCFPILKNHVDDVVLFEEKELQMAICWLLKHHQYLIEPSSAVGLAGCLFDKIKSKGPLVIVLTGRNVSYKTISQLICHNL